MKPAIDDKCTIAKCNNGYVLPGKKSGKEKAKKKADRPLKCFLTIDGDLMVRPGCQEKKKNKNKKQKCSTLTGEEQIECIKDKQNDECVNLKKDEKKKCKAEQQEQKCNNHDPDSKKGKKCANDKGEGTDPTNGPEKTPHPKPTAPATEPSHNHGPHGGHPDGIPHGPHGGHENNEPHGVHGGH